MSELIENSLIQQDADLQMRQAGIDVGVVAEYAEAIAEGAAFPPVTVFFDGQVYWLADGFHRVAAALRAGSKTVSADVKAGGKRDALMFATGVNANHGLRRTNADKRRAVVTVLRDPEWSRMSDREIGKRCCVDHKTVGAIRRELIEGGSGEIPRMVQQTTDHVNGGELPTDTNAASMVERMLAKADTIALVAECRRRGLEVSHAD